METLDNSLISIITPVYNCSKYVEDTIKSVIEQSFSNWEMIIIDDCSTDDSYDIAKKYSDIDKRIILVKQDANKGCAIARNRGLDLAKGRYITFLDGDDLLDKTYLEKQLGLCKNGNPLVSASYRRIANNSITNFIVPEEMNYKKLLGGCSLSCLTSFYDREIIGNPKFCEDMRKNEDFAFWLSILKKGFVAKGNKEVLASYRILVTSKSHNKLKFVKHMMYVYRKKEHICFLKSIHYLIKWAFYGIKKYKNVK